MKNFLRIGNRWFNPASVNLVEMASTVPPKLKVHLSGSHQPWELEGDEAESVLKECGFGKDVRDAADKAKADAEATAAAKQAADDKAAADKAAVESKTPAKVG